MYVIGPFYKILPGEKRSASREIVTDMNAAVFVNSNFSNQR